MSSFQFQSLPGLILLCTVMIVIPSMVSAQITEKIPIGSGIEIGGGHNQLYLDSELFGTHDRTAFSLMPSARIHYLAPLVVDFGIYFLLGYNEFGGRSGEDYSDKRIQIQDRVRLRNLETGMIGLYKILNFQFGMGAKVNRHLQVSKNKYRGTGFSLPNEFGDWSYDGGVRVEFMSKAGITIGAESWIGLSNLAPEGVFRHSMDIRQNHYRFLVGYRFN